MINDNQSQMTTSVVITGKSPVLSVLTRLLDRLDGDGVLQSEIIPWSCPVPTFGDLDNSQLATIGINPSYREFMDRTGLQLKGTLRRFHTLQSLGLEAWAEADSRHLDLMLDSFRKYFSCNPYDAWFRRLDFVIAGANASYYDYPSNACHLDLVPFATNRRWTELSGIQQSFLRQLSGDTLGTIIRDSHIGMLILNGNSVVRQFQSVAGATLQAKEIPAWSLRSHSRNMVKGIAYTGCLSEMSGIKLDRPLRILGFNHNLQSSFGVTSEVVSSIKEWVTRMAEGARW